MSAHLRSRLVELDAQIMEQSARVVEEKRVLDELQQTRFDVEHELYETATFPVLTLPMEITTEVFLHCLRLFDPLSIPNLEAKTSAPVVLSNVCRRWREVAAATPVLWSKLEVRFNKITTEIVATPELVEGLIDRWLSRAGNCPLSLDLSFGNEPSLSRLRDIIHRWSHRVQYIRLDSTGSRHDISPLGLDSAAFPLLQGATLGRFPVLDPLPIILFGSAPYLHTLCLRHKGFTSNDIAFPWSQLTRFEGIVADLLLFTLAPNLTEMTCTFILETGDLIMITHRSLISLTIGDESEDVLEYLTLPALQRLDVLGMDKIDSLEPFLVRSSPPLVSIALLGTQSCFDDWVPCMPLVAGSLESLEFSYVHAEALDSIFKWLSRSLFDSLPKIRALTFQDVDGFSTLRLDELVDFLYSGSSKLRTFSLVWTSSPFLDSTACTSDTTDTISGHLTRLAQTGMELYVGTHSKNYALLGDPAIEPIPI
ncbi:hypothetical protein K438DRAFT_1802813 [Mycena galopus ATCC 62051]|nr:hypothetical protein K438DRAFT_1802813 [Mycena galopus ATCC 62051]